MLYVPALAEVAADQSNFLKAELNKRNVGKAAPVVVIFAVYV
jgi:hypothetical protein